MKRVHIFFIVMAVLSAISLFVPALIIVGFYLFAVPGIILLIAPSVLVYTFLIYSFAKFLINKSITYPYILSSIVLIGAGCIASLILNLPIWKQVDELKNSDVVLQEKVIFPDSVAIFSDHYEPGFQDKNNILCNPLCQYLLYNKATKKVIIGFGSVSPEDIDQEKQLTSYTVEHRDNCQQQGTVVNDKENSAIQNVQMRMASGECLVKSISPLGDASLIFTHLRTFQNSQVKDRWSLTRNAMSINQIGLIKKASEGYRTIYRYSKIEAKPFLFPLSLGSIVGAPAGTLSAGVGFYHYSQYVNYDGNQHFSFFRDFESEMHTIFGDAISPIKESPRADVRERLRGIFGTTGNAKGEKQMYFSSYVGSFIDYDSENIGRIHHDFRKNIRIHPDDIEILSIAINDPDVNDFSRLADMIFSQKEENCLGLREPLVNRLINAKTYEETRSLSRSLSTFSNENLVGYKDRIQDAGFTPEKIDWVKDQSDGKF